MILDTPPSTKAGSQKSTPKLPFMDGLRGIAALYVVFGHINGQEVGTHPVLHAYTKWVWHAIYAVDVFIVLSGFLLMLPVVRSAERKLEGGLVGFWSRRAWRILPAYFAALLASIFYVDWSYLQAHPGVVVRPADFIRFAGAGAVLSHLLLLHNLRSSWAVMLNPPMWSVAMEWQIYFLFALLLLPVWRRLGIRTAVVTAFILGLLPHFLLPSGRNFDWTCPWFVGLFSMGMAGATIVSSASPKLVAWRNHVLWGVVAALLLAALALARPYIRPQDDYMTKDLFQIGADVLMGAATVCFLIYGTFVTLRNAGPRPLILRLLEARGPMALGRMSYSLYLIHFPITWEVLHWTVHWRLTPGAAVAAHILLAVPLSLLAAWVSSELFEMSVRRRAQTLLFSRKSA